MMTHGEIEQQLEGMAGGVFMHANTIQTAALMAVVKHGKLRGPKPAVPVVFDDLKQKLTSLEKYAIICREHLAFLEGEL